MNITLWRAPRQPLVHQDANCPALHMWATGCAGENISPALSIQLGLSAPEHPIAVELPISTATEELAALGLIPCPCVARAATNEWVRENRLEGKVALYADVAGAVGDVLAWPASTIVMVGEKAAG